MRVIIEKSKDFTKDFAYYVARVINRTFPLYINMNQIRYLNEVFYTRLKGRKKINPFNIIFAGFNNLQVIEYEHTFVIQIDYNQKVPNYNGTRLIDICKLINYGNTEFKACPIFTEVFTSVQKNINGIYSAYKRGLLLF